MKKLLGIIVICIAAGLPLQAGNGGRPKVYLFLESQCPCVYSHRETFGSLVRMYGNRVSFVAVFTEASDDNKAITGLLQNLGWKIPYVRDAHRDLVHRLLPRVSTDCVLTDAAGKVLYKGAIDDGPLNMGMVKHYYLRDALDAVLKHQPVAVPTAKGVGCLLNAR